MTEEPTQPPLPPEPPASQPPIPAAPPPGAFPSSSRETEATYRTTGMAVWAVIGVIVLAGLGLIAFGARNVSAPRLPETQGFQWPEWRLPELRLPDLSLPDFEMPNPNNDGEGGDKVENPPNVEPQPPTQPSVARDLTDHTPVGERVDKPPVATGDGPSQDQAGNAA